MDARSFDVFTQRLAAHLPRRHVVASAVGTISTLLFGHAQTVAGCKKAGRKCDKNKDCCDGARCKGGKNGKCRCKSGLNECPGVKACKNLDTDAQHCGECNNACPEFANVCVAGTCESCPAGADHCASPGASCQNDPGCFCLKRLQDGVPICAEFPKCKVLCGDDEDCAGGASFCASIVDGCCSVEAGPGRCADRCGA